MAKIKGEMEQHIVYKHGIANDHKESWQNASQALDQQRYLKKIKKRKKTNICHVGKLKYLP